MNINTSARQRLAVAVASILYTDLVSGVASNLFTKLGNGIVPVSMDAIVVTPFNTGTTDVLDIGDTVDPDAYFADLNLKAAAGTRVAATALPGLINTADGGLQLQATNTAVGTAATAGELMIVLTYAENDVEHFSAG